MSGYQGFIGFKAAAKESSHAVRELIRTVLVLIVIRLVLLGVEYLVVVIFVTTPYKEYLTSDELSSINAFMLMIILCSACYLLCYCGCVIGCYYKLYQAETDVEYCRQQYTLNMGGGAPNPTTTKHTGGY